MNTTLVKKWLLVWFALGLHGATYAASEQPRFALIVGDGAHTGIGELLNPIADASLITETLDDLGFETTLVLDSSQAEMKRQIADSGRKLRPFSKDAISFFYYAGHRVQVEGRNYLLPTDTLRALAQTSSEQQIPTVRELSLWESVSSSRNENRISLFLQAYPESSLADQALTPLIGTLIAASSEPQADVLVQSNSRVTSAPATDELEGANVLPAKAASNATLENTITDEKIVVAEILKQMSKPDRQLQELQLIDKAQSSGLVGNHDAYLNRFPDGIFIDLACSEIESANTSTTRASAAPAPTVESVEQATSVPSSVSVKGTDVTNIDTPLPESSLALGEVRSIGQLARASPFPPSFERLEKSTI